MHATEASPCGLAILFAGGKGISLLWYSFGAMKFIFRATLFFLMALPALIAETPAQGAYFPSTPRDLLVQQYPQYQLKDSSMNPWYLKAKYQLYDKKGKPAEEGTFEFWWVSSRDHRSSWLRPGASYSYICSSKNGCVYTQGEEKLDSFERGLSDALLSPLPDTKNFTQDKYQFSRYDIRTKGGNFPCVTIAPQMPFYAHSDSIPFGTFPAYCFDPKLPVLRMSYQYLGEATEYNKIVLMQGKYLAREIRMYKNDRLMLSATLVDLHDIKSNDAALTFPSGGEKIYSAKTVSIANGIMQGFLEKVENPVYPPDAKAEGASGQVVLRATIGRDGRLRNLQVESTPSPSLASSALLAVAQWRYRPYLLNGEPVEVETTINVIFRLGNGPGR